MLASPHDLSVLHHQDTVSIQDRTHPLSHNEHGGIPHALPQAHAECFICFHIQGGKAVIKQVDFWFFYDSPSNSHALALAAGQIGAALSDFGVVAVRLLFDELVGAGDVGRLPPLFLTAVLISKAQVGGHVSGKEYILLGDIADQIPQLVQFILFYIHIVHIDMAYRGVVKPRDQLEDAGLAATGAPDNGGDLPGPALEANILQHWFVRPEYRYWVTEKYTRLFFGVHLMGGGFEVGGFRIPIIGDRFLTRLKTNYFTGSFVVGGVSIGYQFYLSPHWNLEISGGAGLARIKYHWEPTNPALRKKSYTNTVRYLPVPTEIGFSFVYLFNSKK